MRKSDEIEEIITVRKRKMRIEEENELEEQVQGQKEHEPGDIA